MKWLIAVASLFCIAKLCNAMPIHQYIKKCELLKELVGPDSEFQAAFREVFPKHSKLAWMGLRAIIKHVNRNFTTLLENDLAGISDCPLWNENDQFDEMWALTAHADALNSFIRHQAGLNDHQVLIESCRILDGSNITEEHFMSSRLGNIGGNIEGNVGGKTNYGWTAGLRAMGLKKSLHCNRALTTHVLRFCAITFIREEGIWYCRKHVTEDDLTSEEQ